MPDEPNPIHSTVPMINGEAVSAMSPPPVRSTSKWHDFFVSIGILQIVGAVLFFPLMMSLVGFLALVFYPLYILALGLVALFNLVGLPLYMLRNRPQGGELILGVISLVVSVAIVAYAAYMEYELNVALPKHFADQSQQFQQETQARQRQFEADNARPEITKDEAIALLNTCQLSGFYYTDQTNRQDGEWGELSSTGVVLTKIDGKPYRISIADRLVSALVPVARAAQEKCGGRPQFWHDGHYEAANW